MKLLKDADIKPNTRALVRCDLDVPLSNGVIQDTFRLDSLLPTLSFLKEKGAKIILAGHLGRPNGEKKESLSTNRLRPYFDKVLGSENYELLENLRFNPGERGNSEDFTKELAEKADIFVNESFGNSHRLHASIVCIAKFLPSYAGLRLAEEVETLKKALKDPKKPLVAVIGGAKVETKRPVIDRLLEVADKVLVGGKIGLNWEGDIPEKLHLPHDYAENAKDIGFKTIKEFEKLLEGAGTVIWSGPLGKFEDDNFFAGTKSVAEKIVSSGAYSIVGGGDTLAALDKVGVRDKIDFVSTGGGAMLEFIVKGTLPGLEVLGYNG